MSYPLIYTYKFYDFTNLLDFTMLTYFIHLVGYIYILNFNVNSRICSFIK